MKKTKPLFLLYVLETLRREGIEEYESRRWLAGIRKALARYDIPLNYDDLNDMTSYPKLPQGLTSALAYRIGYAVNFLDKKRF